ncbi:MAG: hypothetical protein ACHQM6_03445, partial [Candidatus Kapaibacterium sp.]
MKISIASYRIAGILLAMLLVASDIIAQCPTNLVPDSVSWTPSFLRSNANGGCWLDITYCFRFVTLGDTLFDSFGVDTGYVEYIVEEGYIDTVILEDSSCPAGVITNAQLITEADEDLFDTLAYPCPNFANKIRMYKADCWKELYNGSNYFFVPCG